MGQQTLVGLRNLFLARPADSLGLKVNAKLRMLSWQPAEAGRIALLRVLLMQESVLSRAAARAHLPLHAGAQPVQQELLEALASQLTEGKNITSSLTVFSYIISSLTFTRIQVNLIFPIQAFKIQE